MPLLPAPSPDDGNWLTSRQLAKARRAQEGAELTLFRHTLSARTLAEIDCLDAEAVADASRASLENELDLLDYGMGRAGQSAAKLELVSRHVERLSASNNRRITRRFG